MEWLVDWGIDVDKPDHEGRTELENEKLGEGELNGEEVIHALLEVGVEWRKPGLLSEQAYKFMRRHPLVLREGLAHTAGVDLHAAEAPAAHRKM